MTWRIIVLVLVLPTGLMGCLGEPDKQKHFVAGAASAGAARAYGADFAKSCLVSLGLGVAKEAYDKASGRGVAEFEDVAATASGCLVWEMRF